MKKLLLFIIALATIATSCKEEEDVFDDGTYPVVIDSTAVGLYLDCIDCDIHFTTTRMSDTIDIPNYIKFELDRNGIYHLKSFGPTPPYTPTIYLPPYFMDSIEVVNGRLNIQKNIQEVVSMPLHMKIGLRGNEGMAQIINYLTINDDRKYTADIRLYTGDATYTQVGAGIFSRVNLFDYSEEIANYTFATDTIYCYQKHNRKNSTQDYRSTSIYVYKYVTGDVTTAPFVVIDPEYYGNNYTITVDPIVRSQVAIVAETNPNENPAQ